MDNQNNNSETNQQHRSEEADKHTEHHNSFAKRNKYRIRQICGVTLLLALITGTAIVLTKCGSDIEDADSSVSANASVSNTTTQTSSETSSGSSDTTSETTTSESTTTQSPSETTTTSATTEEPTTSPSTTSEQTTTTSQSKTTSKTTAQQKTTTASSKQTTKATTSASPVGPSKIEVRNGLTYVNGILIVNKTYSVPASYNPGIDPNAQAAFNKMQKAAALDGCNIWICSGFRSYSYQQYLYNSYVYQDGKAAADRYSARPGHSEHQTGLAMDINYASSYLFDNTKEAKWLAAHCTDYGFIIRYKPGKESSTGYMAESWHIRYLGDVELCKKIEASGLSLEEYLGITSVYAN